MYQGKLVFSQILDSLPFRIFHQCVNRYQADQYVKKFTCLDQFRCTAFAQPGYRESLRDIEVCLRAQFSKLYHMGIKSKVSRNTLSHVNEKRNWNVYADFAQVLISKARKFYANQQMSVDLQNTVYALDSSTIDLCLSTFSWAHFTKTKAAIKNTHSLIYVAGSRRLSILKTARCMI